LIQCALLLIAVWAAIILFLFLKIKDTDTELPSPPSPASVNYIQTNSLPGNLIGNLFSIQQFQIVKPLEDHSDPFFTKHFDQKQPAPAPPTEPPPPERTLSLIYRGYLSGSNARERIAVSIDGIVQFKKPGEQVALNMSIHSVDRTRLVLTNRMGEKLVLKFNVPVEMKSSGK